MADLDTLNNAWYYGASGTGKSRTARQLHPNAYLKAANKWWDGYQGEDTVIIDDLDSSHACLAHHLKIWGDHYPFLAETKGGAIKIRPTSIIITSNLSIEQMWPYDLASSEPIFRRFPQRIF